MHAEINFFDVLANCFINLKNRRLKQRRVRFKKKAQLFLLLLPQTANNSCQNKNYYIYTFSQLFW